MDGDLIPLPDRPLTESEWLVLFWALADTQPSYHIEYSVDDIRPGDRLVTPLLRLGCKMLTDLTLVEERCFQVDPRFKIEGRAIVIETLCRECFRRSLPSEEPTTHQQFGFIGTVSESRRPTFPGPEWHCPHFPITNTHEAVAAWLACTSRTLERWSQSFDGFDRSQPRIDEVSRLMACWVYDDARSLSSRLGMTAEGLSDSSSFSDVIQYLDDLRPAISGSPNEVQEEGSLLFVTISQVADTVHLESKSMTKFVRNWGQPAVIHSGRRPAKFHLSKILPTLKTQFPDLGDDDWSRLKEHATQHLLR